MHLSERVRSVKPSATLTINTKAQEMRAQGRQVTSLAVGEPDFPTPEHVCRAAKEAIDQGFTRYTPVPGIPELRIAVADYFSRFYGVQATQEQVIVTNGGKQSLYSLFQVLLDPGDEVLLPSPYWVSYPAMVQLAGGTPLIVPTHPEEDYLLRTEALDQALTPKTKILVLNSPSNPTGCHYTREQLETIVQWARNRGVFLISDEIYDRLVYPPAEPVSVSPWFSDGMEGIAVVNGLAKSFAMTGWRVGYTLAHPDLIKAMSKIQGQSTSNICSVAQKAALAALTGSWEQVEEMKRSFVRRRDLALQIVRSWPGVVCPQPAGAFYLFPKVDHVYTKGVPDSTTLCSRILEEAEVALVPGAAFGDDRCFRISYALDDATLEQALQKVGNILSALA